MVAPGIGRFGFVFGILGAENPAGMAGVDFYPHRDGRALPHLPDAGPKQLFLGSEERRESFLILDLALQDRESVLDVLT